MFETGACMHSKTNSNSYIEQGLQERQTRPLLQHGGSHAKLEAAEEKCKFCCPSNQAAVQLCILRSSVCSSKSTAQTKSILHEAL